MHRFALFLLTSFGIAGCSSMNVTAITPGAPDWVESTRNCDGSEIDGPVRYTVHFGENSRGGDTGFPTSAAACGEPPQDGLYAGARTLIAGQDLCEVLPPGDWYVAMTAETAEGESSYSNEVRVRVTTQQDDSGSTCRIL